MVFYYIPGIIYFCRAGMPEIVGSNKYEYEKTVCMLFPFWWRSGGGRSCGNSDLADKSLKSRARCLIEPAGGYLQKKLNKTNSYLAQVYPFLTLKHYDKDLQQALESMLPDNALLQKPLHLLWSSCLPHNAICWHDRFVKDIEMGHVKAVFTRARALEEMITIAWVRYRLTRHGCLKYAQGSVWRAQVLVFRPRTGLRRRVTGLS